MFRRTMGQNILEESYDTLLGFGNDNEGQLLEMRYLVISIDVYICNIDDIIEASFVFDNHFEIFSENLI